MALTFAAFQRITADDINARFPLYVPKTAVETVTSSTTLQNDEELFVDFTAGRSYNVLLSLAVTSGSSAGDIKLDWTVTGTVAQVTTRGCLGPSASTADAGSGVVRASRHNLTTAVPYGYDGSTASFITEEFIVSTGASGGRLQLRWAQNASSATGTTVSASSYMVCTPVS